jgi:outer membrane immunogenic protein
MVIDRCTRLATSLLLRGVMLKRFACAAALVSCTSSIAFADGYVGSGPGYIGPFSWSGIYVGGELGGGWADTHWLTNHVRSVGTCAASPGFKLQCDPVDQTSSSFVGGGQVGARWQSGHLVFGLEVSAGDAHFHVRSLDVNAPFVATSTLNNETDVRTLFSSNLQLGYAWDRTLWYVKGGYAGADLRQNTIATPIPANGTSNFAPVSQWANGWTIGSGLEYALIRNISVGVEYNYTRLVAGESTTCTSGTLPSGFACPTPILPALRYTDFRADLQQVLVRLNYKFDSLRDYAPLK